MKDKFSFNRKPYLKIDKKYKGGKGKADVQSLVQGKELFKLSSNENMLGPSPEAVRRIKAHLDELHYYPDRTDKTLRIALAEFYKGQLSADEFLCANSGMELIDMICRAFLGEEDNAIACPPAFRAYKLFTKRAGAELRNVPLKGDEFELDTEAIFKAVDNRTRLIFLNSPNNPTGTIIRKQQISELLSKLPEGVVVVLDEVYYHFNTDPEFAFAYEFMDKGLPVVGVNSLSKTFGLAGLRVGYIYADTEIIGYLRALQRPFHMSTLALEGGKGALADTVFMEKTIALVNSEKEYLYKELSALGVKFWPSQANFIMIRMNMSDEDFERTMLAEGVMVRPVSGFGAENCVRVTIGTREANSAFIAALKNVINKG